jgi:hypothetical protein
MGLPLAPFITFCAAKHCAMHLNPHYQTKNVTLAIFHLKELRGGVGQNTVGGPTAEIGSSWLQHRPLEEEEADYDFMLKTVPE